MSNVTTADLGFPTHRARSFNDRINVPFYIFAPDFRDSSGGIRVLHYLCHILNEMGEEAYLVGTRIASPRLRTPLLGFSKLKQHFLSGQNPVTIYPEVVSHNPTNTPLIVRWLLNIPGHLGRPIEFEPNDLIYYYERWCLPKNLEGHPLFIHPVDHTYFHNDNNPDDDNRVHECYYANKYFLARKPILEEHRDLISVGQEIKRSHEELAAIFRKAKVLYCYEPSGIISEAQACGCPVLLVRSDYWPLPPHDTHHKIPGIAIYGEKDALRNATESLKLIPETHAKARDNSWVMARELVERVYQAQDALRANGKPLLNDFQKLWALDKGKRHASLQLFCDLYLSTSLYFEDVDDCAPSATLAENEAAIHVVRRERQHHRQSAASGDESDAHRAYLAAPDMESYRRWRERRQLGPHEQCFLPPLRPSPAGAQPRFHAVVRATADDGALLADTIASLELQAACGWQLDIFSTGPAPDLACLDGRTDVRWHIAPNMRDMKVAIDARVAALDHDYVIELPAGARLDPLCLYRVAHAAQEAGRAYGRLACFVDDDRIDADGTRHSPRFKPSADPDWLGSMDLLGPLFVSAAAWRELGGACAAATLPWYDFALRVLDGYGEEGFVHVREPLLSLPDFVYGTDHAATGIVAVRRSLARRGLTAKVVRIAEDVWRTTYPLPSTPLVTIAVPSYDKAEYLEQCMRLLLSLTNYPNYEVLIVDGGSQDRETLQLIEQLQQRPEAPIRAIRIAGALDLVAFGNAAAAEANGELLLLMADDIRVIDPNWLHQLVGHVLREPVACVAPVILGPLDGRIESAGIVPGLGGFAASPHQSRARLHDAGYLNMLRVDRSAPALSPHCLLLRTADMRAAGGFDAQAPSAAHAEIDLCRRLAGERRRCVTTAGTSVVKLGASCLDRLPLTQADVAQRQVERFAAQERVYERWFDVFASDRWWSRHLDRGSCDARLELRCVPSWHARPWAAPRILAIPLSNAQGLIRIDQPLNAIQKAGKAHPCIFRPSEKVAGIPLVHDLARHRPDVIIAHLLVGLPSLMTVRQWRRLLSDVFLVYSIDDLFTDMPHRSSLRQGIPADARTYLIRLLEYFDRLVVSTEYLADVYGPYAAETRIVPNRLERDVWMGLQSRRRTGARPRVGWAGGTAHEGDLQLIADVIAATTHEVDWIFMGMCPDNIRPFIREFHTFSDYDSYPARLAALDLDIAVAPLEQIPFNRGKSNLRLLEYGALGIPVVCTDIDPYRNSPACRVRNHSRDWLEALRERIYDPDAAAREGEAMRQWVIDHFIVEDHIDSWLDAHLPSPATRGERRRA